MFLDGHVFRGCVISTSALVRVGESTAEPAREISVAARRIWPEGPRNAVLVDGYAGAPLLLRQRIDPPHVVVGNRTFPHANFVRLRNEAGFPKTVVVRCGISDACSAAFALV